MITGGPTIKRGKSRQDLGTPPEFIAAVEHKFRKLEWDLACTVDNMKAVRGYTYPECDALLQPWHEIRQMLRYEDSQQPLLWLNPPFDPITPWVKKCSEEVQLGAEILLLAAASIDSNWFWKYVQPFATVYCIDRIKFVGQLHVYPKPLMLCHYSANSSRQLLRWRWTTEFD